MHFGSCIFQGIGPFHPSSHVYDVEFSVFLIILILLPSMTSAVITLALISAVSSLCLPSSFLSQLCWRLSIISIFLKNQLLVSLIFSTASLVLMPLISVLISVIFFLVLVLGLNCSSFSRFLRWKDLRLLNLNLSSFLICAFNTINFYLNTAFYELYKLQKVVSSF